MFKTFLISLCLASISLASEVNLNTPSSAVKSYYDAINDGDMDSLKQVMLKDSFDKDMQVYALSIAFQDREFHKTLRQYNNNEAAKIAVVKAVEKKFKSRNKRTKKYLWVKVV